MGPAWSVVSASPWVLGLFAVGVILIVTRLYQRVRWAHLSLRGRDPVRRFSGGVRSTVMSRAGRRCEHHYLYRWRCPETENLEADHVHPHARGGSTTLGNGQVLCKRHNALKGARIPFTWELRRLATLRQGYFPPGLETAVVRRGSASPPLASRRTGDTPSVRTKAPAGAAAPVGSPKPTTADDVLTMWLASFRVDLTPQQRADFLAHPAMPAITLHDPASIEAELPHHQKLDDLARALDRRCHDLAVRPGVDMDAGGEPGSPPP